MLPARATAALSTETPLFGSLLHPPLCPGAHVSRLPPRPLPSLAGMARRAPRWGMRLGRLRPRHQPARRNLRSVQALRARVQIEHAHVRITFQRALCGRPHAAAAASRARVAPIWINSRTRRHAVNCASTPGTRPPMSGVEPTIDQRPTQCRCAWGSEGRHERQRAMHCSVPKVPRVSSTGMTSTNSSIFWPLFVRSIAGVAREPTRARAITPDAYQEQDC